MSLEATIQENTSAIRELIATWAKLTGAAKAIDAKVEAGETGTVHAGGTPVAEVKPKATKPKVEPKVEAPVETAAEPEQANQPEQAAEITVSVADLNAAIIGLAKSKGREAAVAVLTQFGAAKVPELKPSQYADVLVAVKAAAA
jgi:hypothetical protein